MAAFIVIQLQQEFMWMRIEANFDRTNGARHERNRAALNLTLKLYMHVQYRYMYHHLFIIIQMLELISSYN